MTIGNGTCYSSVTYVLTLHIITDSRGTLSILVLDHITRKASHRSKAEEVGCISFPFYSRI